MQKCKMRGRKQDMMDKGGIVGPAHPSFRVRTQRHNE